MNKRVVIVAALAAAAAALFGVQTRAADAAPEASQPPALRGGFREISWDDLVPADWDPLKGLREKNLGMLSDSSPQALQFMRDMRDIWDNAPTVPAMNGAAVKLPGYVVPLEEVKGELKEFLLVPYFGACIHSPPPPANQIVHVVAAKPVKGFRSMDTVWVSGTLATTRQDSHMGVSGYTMQASVVDRYVSRP